MRRELADTMEKAENASLAFILDHSVFSLNGGQNLQLDDHMINLYGNKIDHMVIFQYRINATIGWQFHIAAA